MTTPSQSAKYANHKIANKSQKHLLTRNPFSPTRTGWAIRVSGFQPEPQIPFPQPERVGQFGFRVSNPKPESRFPNPFGLGILVLNPKPRTRFRPTLNRVSGIMLVVYFEGIFTMNLGDVTARIITKDTGISNSLKRLQPRTGAVMHSKMKTGKRHHRSGPAEQNCSNLLDMRDRIPGFSRPCGAEPLAFSDPAGQNHCGL